MTVKLNMTPSLTFMPIKVKIVYVFLVKKEFDKLAIDTNTPILIDYEFGKVKPLLKRKHQKGFKNLYIATSHVNAEKELSDYYFLNGIIEEPTMNVFI